MRLAEYPAGGALPAAESLSLRERSSALPIEKIGCALLFCVLILGGAARFYGLGWGLPYHFHTDERVLAVFAEKLRTAESLAAAAGETYFFLYPPFLFYLLVAAVSAVSLFHPFSPAEPAGGTLYYLLGRGISAAFGTATLGAVYWLGKRLYGRATGLLAAFLLAVTVLHVRDSHFYFPDVPFTFFVVLALGAAADIAERGRLRSYLAAGALAGIGTATKQTAVLVLPAVLAAHLMTLSAGAGRWRKDILSLGFWSRAAVAPGVAALVFLAINPFVLLAPRRFLEMSAITARFVSGESQPHWTFQFTGTDPTYWVTNLLYFGMGPALEALCLLGLTWAVVRRSRGDLLLLAFVVPYFLLVGTGYMKFVRYAVPLLPFLALFGARLVVDAWRLARRPLARAAAGAAIAAVGLASLAYTVAYLNVYRQEDARIQASRWIHRNVPAGATLLIDSSAATPLVGSRFFRPEFYGRTVRENEMYAKKEDHFTIKVLNLLSDPSRPPPSGAWWEGYLRERLAGVEYIAMSDEHYEQYRHRPEAYPVLGAFYRDLFAERLGYRLVTTFKTYPSLLGFELNDDRAELTFRLFDHPRIWIFRRISDGNDG